MWGKSPGARIWWAPSITAIDPLKASALGLALILSVSSVPAQAAAGKAPQAGTELGQEEPVPRFLARVATMTGRKAQALAKIVIHCGRRDVLCAARELVGHLGPGARLVAVTTPDTDRIRRVVSLPAITKCENRGGKRLYIRLPRFGRKVVEELRECLAAWVGRAEKTSLPTYLDVDLRGNGGGNFHRMLALAAVFLGPVRDAVQLSLPDRTKKLSLPTPAWRLRGPEITLWLGPKTASSAVIFASLLKAHLPKLRIMGRPSAEPPRLKRALVVNHAWRFLVPVGRLSVPGVSLTSRNE